MFDDVTAAQRKGQEGERPEQQAQICPICGDSVPLEMVDFHAECEQWTIDQIKKEHPEWVEADGLCPKCLEYYMKL